MSLNTDHEGWAGSPCKATIFPILVLAGDAGHVGPILHLMLMLQAYDWCTCVIFVGGARQLEQIDI